MGLVIPIVAALVAGVGGTVAMVDSLRWWPWLSEHKALAGEVHKIDVRTLESSVKSSRRAAISARVLVHQMKAKGKFSPLLVKDAAELQVEYEDLKALLRKVRGY